MLFPQTKTMGVQNGPSRDSGYPKTRGPLPVHSNGSNIQQPWV